MERWQTLRLDEGVLAEHPPHSILVKAADELNWDVREIMKIILSQPTPIAVDSYNPEMDDILVNFLPGHPHTGPWGPTESDVMIIGKMPAVEEQRENRNLVGPSGRRLWKALRDRGIDHSGFYITNVVRFTPPQWCTKTLRSEHIKVCSSLLQQELALVNPKVLLLLGADAVKAVLGPKMTLTKVRGAILEQDGRTIIACVHPAQVLRQPDMSPGFESDMDLFAQFYQGERVKDPESSYDHRIIKDEDSLATLVHELLEGRCFEFAIDTEWSGRNYTDGSLRTLQISWAAGHAAVVVFRDGEDKQCFDPAPANAVALLRRLLCRDGVRIIGQNFRADMLWLKDIGLDLLKYFYFDTMLASHVLQENGLHSLEALTVKYTNMGRYDLELRKWLSDNKLGPQELRVYGYRGVPDYLLLPYAAKDADATFRVFKALERQLAAEPASVQHLFRSVIMSATGAISEMEEVGVTIDMERLCDLQKMYSRREEELVEELRTMIGDPEFNPASQPQVSKLLFKDLGLTPVKSTDTNTPWEEVIMLPPEERATYGPSTDAESLGILATKNPVASVLRQIRFVGQVNKNFLRDPETDHLRRGLIGLTDRDGRIRSSFSQMTETGRFRSSGPNLQNLPKKQETELEKIAYANEYRSIRSCFVASPGHVLIESDYVAAELNVLAWAAGDEAMKKAVQRDLHSEMAIKMFHLDCEPSEVKEKYPAHRIAGKSVNFGDRWFCRIEIAEKTGTPRGGQPEVKVPDCRRPAAETTGRNKPARGRDARKGEKIVRAAHIT